MNFLVLKNITWDKDFGISIKTHAEYLKQFGIDFYEKIIKLVDRNVKSNALFVGLDEVESTMVKEIISHGQFCNELYAKLIPRNDLNKVNSEFQINFKHFDH